MVEATRDHDEQEPLYFKTLEEALEEVGDDDDVAISLISKIIILARGGYAT